MNVLARLNVSEACRIAKVAIVVTLAVFSSQSWGGQNANVDVFAGGIYAQATDPNVDRLLLRVGGPNNYFHQQAGASGIVEWNAPLGLQEGQYHFQ